LLKPKKFYNSGGTLLDPKNSMPYSSHRRAVTVARLLYLIISILVGVGSAYLISGGKTSYGWLGLIAGLAVGGFFVFVESLSKQFSIV